MPLQSPWAKAFRALSSNPKWPRQLNLDGSDRKLISQLRLETLWRLNIDKVDRSGNSYTDRWFIFLLGLYPSITLNFPVQIWIFSLSQVTVQLHSCMAFCERSKLVAEYLTNFNEIYDLWSRFEVLVQS